MKQACLIFLLVICITTSSYSQLLYGLKAGANNSTYVIDGNYPFKARTSMHAGVMAIMPLNNSTSFQGELFVSGKGNKSKNLSYEYVKQVTYLSLPLLVRYTPVKNIAVAAGPQWSLLLSEKYKGMSFMKNTRSYDIGAIIDLSYQVKNVGLSFRYDYGLTQVDKVVLNQQEPLQYGYRFRDRTFQFGAFFLFSAKKKTGI